MLRKSAEAMLAAVEIYNKPRFDYREESYSILAINAWELLLKTRILHLSSNKLSSLNIYEYRKNKDGSRSKKKKIVRNRTGAPKTLGLVPAYLKLRDELGEKLDENVRLNLIGLLEVRDNAVHFYNKGFHLRKQVHELGTANIKNYLKLANDWFGEDLSDYEFFLMPLAFINTNNLSILGVHATGDEKLGLNFFDQLSTDTVGSETKPFSVMLDIKVGLSKGATNATELVKISNDPSAKRVRITDAQFKERYPWSYQHLTAHLKQKLPEFKLNQDYHKIRKRFEKLPSLCKQRFLDPDNPKSASQKYYNPDIARKIIEAWPKLE